jgi:hypothetical protein
MQGPWWYTAGKQGFHDITIIDYVSLPSQGLLVTHHSSVVTDIDKNTEGKRMRQGRESEERGKKELEGRRRSGNG